MALSASADNSNSELTSLRHCRRRRANRKYNKLFSDFITETGSRVSVPLFFLPNRIMCFCRDSLKVLKYLSLAPFEWFKDAIISFAVPFILYQFRKINWDEPLIKKARFYTSNLKSHGFETFLLSQDTGFRNSPIPHH